MPNRTVYSSVQVLQHLTQATRVNGAVSGTTIDTLALAAGFKSMMFVIQTGTITDGSTAVIIEESDNGTVWTTAATTDVQGPLPAIVATSDNVLFEVGYKGSKRYARLTLTTSGATTGGVFGVVVVLGNPRRFPTVHL